MNNFWDERYLADEYVYGENPNEFFSQQLALLTAGKLLLPAEGEGRNAVHASINGWKTRAFDLSSAGKSKAMRLAAKHGVSIDYQVGELASIKLKDAEFDAMALIFAHFNTDVRQQYHQRLSASLRSGAIVILEGFSKEHVDHQCLNPTAGGPRDASMLYSKDEILSDFPDFETVLLEESEIVLSEGPFHQGSASVLRYVGRKR